MLLQLSAAPSGGSNVRQHNAPKLTIGAAASRNGRQVAKLAVQLPHSLTVESKACSIRANTYEPIHCTLTITDYYRTPPLWAPFEHGTLVRKKLLGMAFVIFLLITKLQAFYCFMQLINLPISASLPLSLAWPG